MSLTGTRSGTRQRPPSVIDHGPLRRLIVAIDFDSASIDSTACPRAFLLLLLLLFIGYFFHLEPAQPTRSRMLKKKKRERNHHPSLLSLMVLASIVSSVSNRIFTEFFFLFLGFFFCLSRWLLFLVSSTENPVGCRVFHSPHFPASVGIKMA